MKKSIAFLFLAMAALLANCTQSKTHDSFEMIPSAYGLDSCKIKNRIYENPEAPIVLAQKLDGPYREDSSLGIRKPSFREIRIEDLELVAHTSRKRLYAGYFVRCGRHDMVSAPQDQNPYSFEFCPEILKPGFLEYEVSGTEHGKLAEMLKSGSYEENGIFIWPKERLDLKEAGELAKKFLIVEHMVATRTTTFEDAETDFERLYPFQRYLIHDARLISPTLESSPSGAEVHEKVSYWYEGTLWAQFEKIRTNSDGCLGGLDEAVRLKRKRCADHQICPEKIEETY